MKATKTVDVRVGVLCELAIGYARANSEGTRVLDLTSINAPAEINGD